VFTVILGCPRTIATVAMVRGQPFADVYQSMLKQALCPGADLVFGDDLHTLHLLRERWIRKLLLA
jgi:hypothetical protein